MSAKQKQGLLRAAHGLKASLFKVATDAAHLRAIEKFVARAKKEEWIAEQKKWTAIYKKQEHTTALNHLKKCEACREKAKGKE